MSGLGARHVQEMPLEPGLGARHVWLTQKKAERLDMFGLMAGYVWLDRSFWRIVRDFPKEVSCSSFHFCCQDENRMLPDRLRSNLI
jgi:hypothetical protein